MQQENKSTSVCFPAAERSAVSLVWSVATGLA